MTGRGELDPCSCKYYSAIASRGALSPSFADCVDCNLRWLALPCGFSRRSCISRFIHRDSDLGGTLRPLPSVLCCSIQWLWQSTPHSYDLDGKQVKELFCTASRYRPGAHLPIIAALLCSAPLSAVFARLSGLSAVVDQFTAGCGADAFKPITAGRGTMRGYLMPLRLLSYQRTMG